MTDEPTTPAVEGPLCGCAHSTVLHSADERVTKLTLRCGDLRAQRDEARAERDEARQDRAAAAEWYLEAQRQRDEARAQVVACQTEADDLRARVREAADWCRDRANSHDDDEGADDAYAAAEDYVRWALDGER